MTPPPARTHAIDGSKNKSNGKGIAIFQPVSTRRFQCVKFRQTNNNGAGWKNLSLSPAHFHHPREYHGKIDQYNPKPNKNKTNQTKQKQNCWVNVMGNESYLCAFPSLIFMASYPAILVLNQLQYIQHAIAFIPLWLTS